MGNKTVTVDGQKVAARQTVASLPSDYKQTEAREFAKAAAFQQAKKNPNVTVGVDSKGQPVAKAVQKSRTEAGASARTAEGNKARVQQNARARAQAAAVNRKMSGRSISQTKAANQASMRQRASERNKAFQAAKKAGTLSKSARTAAGQRARNKAAAKARAKAAAKRRRSKKSGKKCDIFLKYNISPLTNMNLIRDDLAEVAYFVKELQA
jgi:colicin import membrane protein|tara:strand:- start:302 stop:931 length:630 start_codon:yes stop_codon:yes gene_type:complete